MNDLSSTFAIAHNYRMELPSSYALEKGLDDITLTQLLQKAQAQRSKLYDVFVQEFKTRLGAFLEAHKESPMVYADVIEHFPGDYTMAELNFSSTAASIETLQASLETMFGDMRIIPSARQEGASWKNLPISRQPSGPEWHRF